MLNFERLQPMEHALSVAQKRHDLLASNLSRLYVSGAERYDINFEAALKAEGEPIESFQTTGGKPELSREVAAMAANDSYYLAAAKFTSLYMANLRSSFRG